MDKDEIKGRAKQAAGAITGDEDLEREGKVDRIGGEVKDKVDRVADKVKDAFTSEK